MLTSFLWRGRVGTVVVPGAGGSNKGEPASVTAISAHRSAMDSTASWVRLSAAVALATIGGVGMWSFPVALPTVQADFAIARADASLPFTLAMLGFAFGGPVMG